MVNIIAKYTETSELNLSYSIFKLNFAASKCRVQNYGNFEFNKRKTTTLVPSEIYFEFAFIKYLYYFSKLQPL